MRHKRFRHRLGRSYSLRKATLRDLAKSAIIYQSIRTTRAKAKAVSILIDRLISLGKDGSLAARRRAFAILCDHDLVKKLFSEISPRYKSRKGGYTRIFNLLERRGDNASQVILELTEKIVKEKKVRAEKPKKEEARPTEGIPEAVGPAEAPAPVIEKPKPEAKKKPEAKREKPKPTEKPKPAEKPKPKAEEKPKPKEEKPKGIFGGLGRLFKKPKES